MNSQQLAVSLAAIVFSSACAAVLAAPVAPPAEPPADAGRGAGSNTAVEDPAPSAAVDPKWLERLPKDERAAMDELVGKAPPAVDPELQWPAGKPVTWDDLRGRVIVVQSFTTASTAGRKWPERMAAALKDVPAKDIQLIALHTPEEAAGAADFLQRKPAPANVLVAIDPKGAFCDALNFYKDPANIIIDKHGFVRYAALNVRGLEEAATALAAEPFDPAKRPEVETASASTEPAAAEFPKFTGAVTHAKDVRGKPAPAFHVDDWITDQVSTDGKVTVIDFWATWCPPCVATIPHMNELAKHFGDQIACIGISDEKPVDFARGMDKKNLKADTFNYALALDPSSKMKGALQIKGIPHCIVMSKDWIVRWQGHPGELTRDTLQKIVDADAAQGGNGGGSAPPTRGGPKRKRWVE